MQLPCPLTWLLGLFTALWAMVSPSSSARNTCPKCGRRHGIKIQDARSNQGVMNDIEAIEREHQQIEESTLCPKCKRQARLDVTNSANSDEQHTTTITRSQSQVRLSAEPGGPEAPLFSYGTVHQAPATQTPKITTKEISSIQPVVSSTDQTNSYLEEIIRREKERADERKELDEAGRRQRRETEEAIRTEEARLLADRENWGTERREEARAAEMERKSREMREKEEREAADRIWKETQLRFSRERERLGNDYTAVSKAINDQRDAELSRLAEAARKTDEQFERDMRAVREEIARTFEANRNLRRIQSAYWSRQAELEWAERLSSLRTVHEPFRSRFCDLRVYMHSHIQGTDADLSDIHQYVQGELLLLKDELIMIMCTMEDEIADMQEFKKERPQAKFIIDIEESARGVGRTARILLSMIDEIAEEMRSENGNIINSSKLNVCQNAFTDLEKAVEKIPTVVDLKAKYET